MILWSTTRTAGPGRHAEPWAGRLRWRHRRRWSTGAPCRSRSLPVWGKRNQTLTVSARSALALAQVRWIGRELNTFRPLASSSYLLRRRHHYGWHVRSVGVGLATERIWLFSWSSFDRGLRLTCSPWRIGVCEGVDHQLAPGERCIHREVCVPAAETDACGRWTVSGTQPAVAQLGEPVGDGCDRAEDAPDPVAAVWSGPGRGVQPE